ncbi:hypothetical protein EVAR_72409_1 [Eumeta japonica]|uniref:Uncharacterized protein n=1 Tax=Eumeta variegata TaxID=151549 RepID=A0A4C1TLR9_EUMVA|nr:hypothetical protein EVAR_72409_1 [Eumeta japonica]
MHYHVSAAQDLNQWLAKILPLGVTPGHQPPWYRYYNPRIGLEEQSYSTAMSLLSSQRFGTPLSDRGSSSPLYPESKTSTCSTSPRPNLPPKGNEIILFESSDLYDWEFITVQRILV